MNRRQRNKQKMAARRLLAEFSANLIALENAIEFASLTMTDSDFESYYERKKQHLDWLEECITYLRLQAKL